MKKKIEDINNTYHDDKKQKLFENIQQCQGILKDFDDDDKIMQVLKDKIQSLKDKNIKRA